MNGHLALAAMRAPRTALALPLASPIPGEITLGCVFGAALNHPDEYGQLAAAMHAPPYRQPPQRPVLYLKPANTHCPDGSAVALDPDIAQICVAPCVALVLGAPLMRAGKGMGTGVDAKTRTEAEHAAEAAILGYTLAADLSVPHASFYRPAIRDKCRDGFLPIGPCVIPAGAVELAALTLSLSIAGQPVLQVRPRDLRRKAIELLLEISQFMHCAAGDVLLLGPSQTRAFASPGAAVSLEAAGLGKLHFTLTRADAFADTGDRS